MKRAGALYLLMFRLRSWFCRGPTREWHSDDSSVVVRICEGCDSISVQARNISVVAKKSHNLPRLLEEMERAMRTAGAEAEASDLRRLLAEAEEEG